jgi:hypothetical protein
MFEDEEDTFVNSVPGESVQAARKKIAAMYGKCFRKKG